MAKVDHDCNRDMCYLDRVKTWFTEVVDPCLPGDLRGSDFDYVLERNGRLLVIEAKSSNNHTLPDGQRILFEQVTGHSDGGIAVIVVYREKDRIYGPREGEVLWCQKVWKGEVKDPEACSTEQFQDMVKRWYSAADGGEI